MSTTNLLDSILSNAPAIDISGDNDDARIAAMHAEKAARDAGLQVAPSCSDAADETTRILRECDADWSPEAVIATTPEGHPLPGRAMIRDDNRTPIGGLGLVSDKYQPVCNRTLVAPIVGAGYDFVGGACTDNGRAFRAEFSLGEEMDVGDVGDIVRARAVLVALHDGSGAASLALNTYRLWCANGACAVQDSVSLRVRHNGDVAGQVADFRAAVADLMAQWRNTRSLFMNLQQSAARASGIGAGMTEDDMVRAFVAAIRGRSEIEQQTKKRAGTAERVLESYHTAPGQAQTRGTAWGLANAWTHYSSHVTPRQGAAKRALSKVAGPAAKEDRRALVAAYAFSKNIPLEDVMDVRSPRMRAVAKEASAGGVVETLAAGEMPSRFA